MEMLEKAIGTIIGNAINMYIFGFIAFKAFNVVFLTFGLPTFSFWVYVGVVAVLRFIFR